MLRSKGISPDYVAGHSLGEYSALVAAGSLDFGDALRLVRKRGQYMQEAVPPGAGAMAAILNTLLFFPSGAIYPVEAFPVWLRAIAKVDPFTYAVHGFKSLLLKETGLAAIVPDMIYLSIFALITLALAVPLFKRTL